LLTINKEAKRLWDGMSTQWRTDGFGLVGLDYSVMRDVASMLMPEVEITPRRFAKIQGLERAALQRQRKRLEKKSTESAAGT
tara:strand:+ start:203 stop:448 length:246 start_codon:yes stop_codon:yes gene_type:complete